MCRRVFLQRTIPPMEGKLVLVTSDHIAGLSDMSACLTSLCAAVVT